MPIGDGGPAIVQPDEHDPELTLSIAGLPAIVLGVIPAVSAVSVIFTDSVADETN
jgi:hypothetical protein